MAYIDGLKRFTQKLDGLANGEAIKQAMGKCCALVEKESKENCPKDTGELRRSIDSRIVEEPDMIQGIVFSDKEYAPYVLQGTGLFAVNGDGRKDVPWHYQDDNGNWHSTSGQHPQPFMEKALDDNKDKCLNYIKQSIKGGTK